VLGESDIEAMRRRARRLEDTRLHVLEETRDYLITCGKELSQLHRKIFDAREGQK
jgi:hypothetical protein